MPYERDDNDIAFMNEEVKEILGAAPQWIVRWGNVLILALVLLLVFLSALIKYPEMIYGRVTVSPAFEIVDIKVPANSILTPVNLHDGAYVQKGRLLFLKKKKNSLAASGADSITAPIDGKIIFQRLLQEGEVISDTMPLLHIVPIYQKYDAVVAVPYNGSGMIQLGQSVTIKLGNYPAAEFGSLTGVVCSRPLYNGHDAILQVKLNNCNLTTYHKQLTLYQPAEGVAEITLSENRLIRRVFNFLK